MQVICGGGGGGDSGSGNMPVKSAQSSFRDRTQEFQGIQERLRKSFASSGPGSNGASGGSKTEEQRSAVAHQSEFNRRASKIGFGIHQTSQKLSKLAKCGFCMLRSKCLICFVSLVCNCSNVVCVCVMLVAKRTSVFDDPTMEIQELTAVIKQEITALNSAVVDLQLISNSRNDSTISSDTTCHSTTVVDDLKNRLISTTKEFKEVLTMRTEVRSKSCLSLVN